VFGFRCPASYFRVVEFSAVWDSWHTTGAHSYQASHLINMTWKLDRDILEREKVNRRILF
jgi:hypothetical protein